MEVNSEGEGTNVGAWFDSHIEYKWYQNVKEELQNCIWKIDFGKWLATTHFTSVENLKWLALDSSQIKVFD